MSASTSAPAARLQANAQGPMRVLLIEDSSEVAEPFSRLLQLWGYEVSTAQDGPSAIACVRAVHPDVIFLDIGLPGAMNGYAVAEELRRLGLAREALVVALTGRALPEDKERSAQVGIVHHLVKPVAPDVLRDFLRRVTARRNIPSSPEDPQKA
jgi:CheY-like chemotaxis protein